MAEVGFAFLRDNDSGFGGGSRPGNAILCIGSRANLFVGLLE
jgi:hypothetical protein